MKKFSFILAIVLSSFALGCATTQTVSKGTWSTWQTPSDITSIVDDMASGNLQKAEDALIPALRASNPAAAYLYAEIAALQGMNAVAIDRFSDFVLANPKNSLTAAAIARMIVLADSTLEPFNWEKIASLRTSDPYAAARLVVLQNKAMRSTAKQAELKHPTALALTQWQWFGPFSPYLYTGFASDQVFDADPVLADSYEVDGKKLLPFQYPKENVTTMSAAKTGIYAAETRINVDNKIDVMLIVHATQLYKIDMDGNEVLIRTANQIGQNKIQAVRMSLAKGEHLIRIKLGLNAANASTRHISLWLAPADMTLPQANQFLANVTELDNRSGALPDSKSVKKIQPIDLSYVIGSQNPPKSSDTLHNWIGAMLAVYDGNAQIADSLIQSQLEHNPDDYIAQYWKAMRYRIDADLDASVRSENAIHILKNITENAPQLVQASELLILEFIKQNQPKQALDSWNASKASLPQNADTSTIIAELAKNLDWPEISDEYTIKAAEQSPDSCRLNARALAVQFRKHQYTAFDALPKSLQSCPSIIHAYAKKEGNDTPYNIDSKRWKRAVQQLSAAYPNDASLKLEALVDAADENPDLVSRQFLDHLEDVQNGYYPDVPSEVALRLIDKLRAQKKDEQAQNILKKLLFIYPSIEEYRNFEWQITGKKPFEDLRIDTFKVIQDYVNQNRNDAGGSVMLLDYAATHIYPNGAKLGLTHQISRVLSKEGKNEVGEIYLPQDAAILKIRTIKDNTFEVIEPESIDFKQSITAPNLDIGDYVEIEYLTFEPNISNYAPRVITDTFFYGSDQSPLVKSEYIFEYPKDWQVDIIESGPENQITQSCAPVGDYMRCSAKRENIPVFITEPRAPSGFDVIPNIQVYHNYSWDVIRKGLYETVTRQSRITPYVQRFYDKIGMPENDSVWQHAQFIYDQVIESIDESESVQNTDNETATQSVTRGVGSRIMTLKALYDIAQIPSYFALVKSVIAPKNAEKLPSQYNAAYATMLVVETEKGPAYAQPSEDFVPFDYLGLDFQNQQVIPLDPSREIFKSRTENLDELSASIQIEYDLKEDGSAKAKSKEIMRGTRALIMRNFLNTLKNDEDKSKQVIQNSLANSYGRIELTRLENENLDDKNKPLTLYYDFDIASLSGVSDNKIEVLSKIFAYNLVKQYAQLPTRKYPVLINSDSLSHRKLIMHAPEGYTWDSETLTDITIETPYGKFTRHTKIQGKDLELSESIQILPQRIEVKDYPEFRNFCLAVDEAQRTTLIGSKR